MELLIIFVFGLVIGSFLLVLIERLPKDQPVVAARSECDFCHHVLSPLDLIPVISFVFLGGRCRYCHKKLSFKYPLIELFLGLSFVALYLSIQANAISYPLIAGTWLYLFFFLAIIYSTLVVIFFTDLLDGIIPLYVLLVGVCTTIIYLFISNPSDFISYFLTGTVTSLFFLAIFLATKRRGIGFGDVIYGFYMGILLGFPTIIVGLYVAFLTGAIVSIILVIAKKKKLRGDSVPFGPFLIFGTVVALVFGEGLWSIAKIYVGL